VGGSKTRPAGEVDLRALGEFITDAHGRDHVTKAQMAFDGDGKITGLKVQHHRQSRRLYVDLLVGGADVPLCHLVVGPVRDPAHLLRGRRGLYQHRAGPTPIAAPAARKRLTSSNVWSKSVRANSVWIRRPAQEEFRQDVPLSDVGGVAL